MSANDLDRGVQVNASEAGKPVVMGAGCGLPHQAPRWGKASRSNRIDICKFLGSTRTLWFDVGQGTKSLDTLFSALVGVAHDGVAYYEKVGRNKSVTSWWLRITGLVLGTAGALCPLLAASGWPGTRGKGLTSAGYILLALAAALVGADSAFGASAGRARCLAAQLEVEALIASSIVKWAAIKQRLPLQPDSKEPTESPETQGLKLVNEFTRDIFQVVRREEEGWQSNFTGRIAELQQRIKSLEQEPTKGKPPETK